MQRLTLILVIITLAVLLLAQTPMLPAICASGDWGKFCGVMVAIGRKTVDGDDVVTWPLLKVIAAIGGGIAAYVIRREDSDKQNVIPFVWRGLLIAIVSGFAGVCFVRPADIKAAFVAGLVGWWSAVSFIRQSVPREANKGGADQPPEEEPEADDEEGGH